jgi:hypothetical protein
MIDKGTYKARAVEGALGFTSNDNEQVAVLFETIEPQPRRITWYGFFTEATSERTLESLRHMGWKGDDLSDLSGITDNEVYIVVDHEDYQGKTQARVRWVNSGAGGALAMKATMDKARAQAFAARMKGAVVAQRQKMPKPATVTNGGVGGVKRSEGAKPWEDDDVPF